MCWITSLQKEDKDLILLWLPPNIGILYCIGILICQVICNPWMSISAGHSKQNTKETLYALYTKCSRKKKLMNILRTLLRENARKRTNAFRDKAMNTKQSGRVISMHTVLKDRFPCRRIQTGTISLSRASMDQSKILDF